MSALPFAVRPAPLSFILNRTFMQGHESKGTVYKPAAGKAGQPVTFQLQQTFIDRTAKKQF